MFDILYAEIIIRWREGDEDQRGDHTGHLQADRLFIYVG
jgi:hypothetical protein